MTGDVVLETLRKIVADSHIEVPEINADSRFADLEIDSLVLLELSVVLERTCGVKIFEDELVEAGTVRAVMALLEERSAVG
ncbi:acyl carrier protein [Actinomadura rubteroloni]|uniref:Acyl carrier protein n=1 Tax=Actinomadura rubteroloni TaxID=1926885 RepID=A0A2P4UMV6_9ACTN|nr:phosphopantetheine-binding protein [Actinomadura rubteroloni]POM26375.1 acyl carrier protein [Actinomadura rubteroloni]